LPHLRRDPAYLAANHYEVTTSRGELVTSSAVSEDVLTRLRSGQYLLRQAPGPTNALGLVKFMFPNNASVYLHDTPARSLFAKVRRDFSHGCIRLEKAAEFAAWALQEEPDWTRERIGAAMNGSETLQVNLKKPIPLMVTYITAVVLETGEVRFFEDLYGYDKRVLTSGALGPRPRE
jgi:murein L,D-transpeptidase YcbB/YkuD